MKKTIFFVSAITVFALPFTAFAASLEIDIEHEINLKNGMYIAKEYGGQGRYALISHDHGRFEGGPIAAAVCTDGFVVSKLPNGFGAIKKALKPTDYVLTRCVED